MKATKNEWKRKSTAILFTSLILIVCMMPMTVMADEPADGVYKLADIDEPPKVIRAVPPKYPFEAKEEKVEGRVVVELIVTKNGIPYGERVVDAEPPDVFEVAALETIEQYQFIPAKKNGEAVDVRVRLPIKFALDEGPFNLDPEAKPLFDSAHKWTEVDSPPRVIEASLPEYPSGAKQAKIEGKVDLMFVVATDGLAKEPQVVTAAPVDIFESAALDAIALYKFEPAKKNGLPVNCIVQVPIVFKLDTENNGSK